MVPPKAHARGLPACPIQGRRRPSGPRSGQRVRGREGSPEVLTPSLLSAALQLDKEGLVDAAPFSFRALLGALGIEAALESLISSLH